MERDALLVDPDAAGRPKRRKVLFRTWDRTLPIAGWLMTNPSEANHLIDDPTAGRTVTISTDHGCGASWLGNMWDYRTPYPRDLWAALAAGEITETMVAENCRMLEMIGAVASLHVVAFGAEPMRRFPGHCNRMLDAFMRHANGPLLCLGVTTDGMPLHPLARGKHAIRTGTKLRPWSRPK